MMELERFRELLDAYGGDPGRWPPAERAAAEALLANAPEAAANLAEARALDRLLDRATPLSPPILDAEALIARVTVAAQVKLPVYRPATHGRSGRGLWLRAAGLAAAAIIGFIIGWTQLSDTGDASAASGSVFDFAGDTEW